MWKFELEYEKWLKRETLENALTDFMKYVFKDRKTNMSEDTVEKKNIYGNWWLATEKDSRNSSIQHDNDLMDTTDKMATENQWFPLTLMHWVPLTFLMDALRCFCFS